MALYRYGLYRYGLYSYGVYSYGLYSYGRDEGTLAPGPLPEQTIGIINTRHNYISFGTIY